MAIINGNKSNNTLIGTEEDDVISGAAGNDVLNGLGGADRLVGGTGNDTLRGGINNDIYVVDSLFDVIDEEGNTDADDVVETSLINVDLGTMFGGSVEHATLTGSTSLNATGNGADNRLTGNGASNVLDGGDGNDSLIGGSGNDTLLGEIGNDSLLGGSGNDTLLGGLGNDTLDGGKGNDVLRGGANNDTYVINSTGDVIDEEGNIDSNDTVVASISVDLSTLAGGAIENATLTGSGGLKAIGNTADNVLIGNTGNNLLNGAAGNDVLQSLSGRDTLDGGSGADLLLGGSGNDTYIIDDLGDAIDEEGNTDAVDAVLASVTVDISTLGAGAIENVTLTGTGNIDAIGNAAGNLVLGNSGNNLLDGAGGNDVLQSGGGDDTVLGGSGDDSLDGGTGNDALKGGDGNDTYVLDSANDSVDEEGNSDTDDLVKANFSIDLTTFAGGAIEHVTLTGSSSRNVTGNGSANALAGNGGANVLNGGVGDDVLIGNGGKDTLLGGDNNDKMTGGTGNDSIDGGAGDDSAYFSGNLADYQITVGPDGTVTVLDLAPTVNGNDGTDKISNVETVHFLDASLSFGHAPSAPADGDAAPNAILENAAGGTLVGIDADSSDVDYNDSVTYSLVNSAGGRFVIDPVTGVVSVAAGAVFDSASEPSVSVTVRATDSTGKFSDAAFDITIQDSNPNQPPVAESGANSGNEDGVINGQLTASDPDGDALSFALAAGGAPAHGQVVVNPDGSYSYTPDANYNGSDSFTYEVSDGKGGTATATVNLTIAPVNDAPAAQVGSNAGNEDTAIGGQLTATDVDGDSLSFALAAGGAPVHGQVVINPDGSYSYTPDADYHGADSFTYEASDGKGSVSLATVSLTIAPVNDAPILSTPEGTVTRVSTDSAGAQANGESYDHVFSPDGTKVAFLSWATNLVAGDTNVVQDIFVKDLVTGGITRVSTDSAGAQSNSHSVNPIFSPDGTKIAFLSFATNLVAGDTNGVGDIFVKDLATGTITRVSTSGIGAQGNNHSFDPVFSPDGTKVAFFSSASNLVAGDTNGTDDVFVKDLVTGAITRVSATSAGAQGNSSSDQVVFSPDGTKVMFRSFASNLVTGDTNSNADIFVKDLVTGVVTRVSTTSAGVQGNNESREPVFSPDGTKVAFLSFATNLVTGDTNGVTDIFVKDLVTGAIARVSTDGAGVQGNGSSISPVFSPDGTKVLFSSAATNLVPGDTNGHHDTFVKDLVTGTIIRVSTSSSGAQGNSGADGGVFSPDGTQVMFYSAASNMVVGDTNGLTDIFVKELVGKFSFASIAEDAVSNSGQTVASLLGTAVSDTDAGALQGIAIIGADNSHGSWQFSLDGGNAWSLIGTVSDQSAVLLAPDALVRFAPNADWSGTSQIVVRVWDQTDGHPNGAAGIDVSVNGSTTAYSTASVQASITVTPVNDAPVAEAESNDGSENTVIVGQLAASDAEGDGLTFSLAAGGAPAHGTVEINPNGSYTYTPNANYYGADSFTFEVSDGKGGFSTATVSLTINPLNDAPVAVAGSNVGDEDTILAGTLSATDADGDGLSFALAAGGAPAHGTVEINPSGAYAYTPSTNYHGADSFTFEVTDGKGGFSTATVSLTINSANDVPVALAGSNAGDEDTILAGTLSATDADGDGLSFALAAGGAPAHGTVEISSNGTYAYTPDANYHGADSFAFEVSDAKGGFSTATVSLTINPLNDAPVAVAGSNSGDEDTILAGTLSATDVDGDGLAFALAAGGAPAHGMVEINPNGTYAYTPNANYHGADSFTFEVSDGKGGFSTATVSLTINSVNDAPVALAGSNAGDEDTILAGTLSATDVDGDDLAFTLAGAPLHGTVVINPDGNYAYTPQANYHGSDSFTYEVSDGKGGVSVATVNLTINSVDDAPTNLVDSDAAANVILDNATAGAFVGLTLAAFDADGDVLTYSLTDDAGGRFQVDPTSGLVTVAAGATLEPGTYEITAAAHDGNHPVSVTQIFAITVESSTITPLDLQISTSAYGTDGTSATTSSENGGDGGDSQFDWSNQSIAGTSLNDTINIHASRSGGSGGYGGNGDAGANGSYSYSEVYQKDENGNIIFTELFESHTAAGDGTKGGDGGAGGDGTAQVLNTNIATSDGHDSVWLTLQSQGGHGLAGGSGGMGGSTGHHKELYYSNGATHSAGATGGDGGAAGTGGDAGSALSLVQDLEIATGSDNDSIVLELYSYGGQGGSGGHGGSAGSGAVAGSAADGGAGGDGGDARSRLLNSVIDAGSDHDTIRLYLYAFQAYSGGGPGGMGGGSGGGVSETGGPTDYSYVQTYADGSNGGNAGAEGSALVEMTNTAIEGDEGNDLLELFISGGISTVLSPGGAAGYAGESYTSGSYTYIAGAPGNPGLPSSPGEFVVNITGNTFSGGADDDTIVIALFDSSSEATISFSGNTFAGGTGTDLLSFGHYNGANEMLGGINVDLSQGTVTILGQTNTISGVENVIGSSVNDTLIGDSEDSSLHGWLGDDVIAGGGGNDVLTGGNNDLDADTFVFALNTSGDDTITDFGKTSDKLSFFDVLDSNGDSVLDLADLEALVDSVVDDGASVLVSFTTGASVLFQYVGTGSVATLSDLVGESSSQILIG